HKIYNDVETTQFRKLISQSKCPRLPERFKGITHLLDLWAPAIGFSKDPDDALNLYPLQIANQINSIRQLALPLHKSCKKPVPSGHCNPSQDEPSYNVVVEPGIFDIESYDKKE